jgi:hypothetical protein
MYEKKTRNDGQKNGCLQSGSLKKRSYYEISLLFPG